MATPEKNAQRRSGDNRFDARHLVWHTVGAKAHLGDIEMLNQTLKSERIAARVFGIRKDRGRPQCPPSFANAAIRFSLRRSGAERFSQPIVERVGCGRRWDSA